MTSKKLCSENQTISKVLINKLLACISNYKAVKTKIKSKFKVNSSSLKWKNSWPSKRNRQLTLRGDIKQSVSNQ